jgi:hypothetical protein
MRGYAYMVSFSTAIVMLAAAAGHDHASRHPPT